MNHMPDIQVTNIVNISYHNDHYHVIPTLCMLGQLDEVLAPKPIHNLAEHYQAEAVEDFEHEHELSDEHHDSQDHAHETADESGIHG